MSLLTADKAAARIGITVDELITSRQRGLPPGSLGFRFDGELVWRAEDLPEPLSICEVCGFQARTAGGLASHQRARH